MYEDQAMKMLQRVKRRVGLKDGSVGSHINIPFGWTELTLLAQCKGEIHQECLDVLLLSLDQAPVGKYQIPALFYLVETVLYWLQTESTQQSYLRSSEVKLLKIGELVCYRLYYHNMAGQLYDEKEAKSRLVVYLDGYDELEALYDPYPNSVVSFCFIGAVGRILTADSTTEEKELTESDGERVEKSKRLERTADSLKTKSSASMKSLSITSEVHKLSPTLWHALDVWRCACNLGGDLRPALQGLWKCARSLRRETWIDVHFALTLLAEAAKSSMDCVNLFLAIVGNTLENSRENYDFGKTPESMRDSARNLKPQREGGTSIDPADTPIRPDHLRSGTDLSSSKASNGNHPSWTWKVAVCEVQLLTHIALYGRTSKIRQAGLVGRDGVSLVELTRFQLPDHDGSEDDWSWRVRYSALQGLVSVSQAAQGDPTRECLRNAAWEATNRAQGREQDSRVLEALKVGQVSGHLERLVSLWSGQTGCEYSFLPSRAAQALSVLYLPSLPPPVEPPRSTQAKPTNQTSPRKTSPSLPPPARVRTTVKEELTLANALQQRPPGFFQRQNFNLFRVVEDQWRKDLHLLQELAEEEKTEELKEDQERYQQEISKIHEFRDRRKTRPSNVQTQKRS